MTPTDTKNKNYFIGLLKDPKFKKEYSEKYGISLKTVDKDIATVTNSRGDTLDEVKDFATELSKKYEKRTWNFGGLGPILAIPFFALGNIAYCDSQTIAKSPGLALSGMVLFGVGFACFAGGPIFAGYSWHKHEEADFTKGAATRMEQFSRPDNKSPECNSADGNNFLYLQLA